MYQPLTEEQMTAVQMRTMDPTHELAGRPVPALTTLLYRICDRDGARFEEATRLIALFVEQARREDAEK